MHPYSVCRDYLTDVLASYVKLGLPVNQQTATATSLDVLVGEINRMELLHRIAKAQTSKLTAGVDICDAVFLGDPTAYAAELLKEAPASDKERDLLLNVAYQAMAQYDDSDDDEEEEEEGAKATEEPAKSTSAAGGGDEALTKMAMGVAGLMAADPAAKKNLMSMLAMQSSASDNPLTSSLTSDPRMAEFLLGMMGSMASDPAAMKSIVAMLPTMMAMEAGIPPSGPPTPDPAMPSVPYAPFEAVSFPHTDVD